MTNEFEIKQLHKKKFDELFKMRECLENIIYSNNKLITIITKDLQNGEKNKLRSGHSSNTTIL